MNQPVMWPPFCMRSVSYSLEKEPVFSNSGSMILRSGSLMTNSGRSPASSPSVSPVRKAERSCASRQASVVMLAGRPAEMGMVSFMPGF